MSNLVHKTVRLKVTPENCRSFSDPNQLGRKRYFAQVPVEEIHRARIEYGPNPRNQNMETKVSDAIIQSLKNEPGWFMYYNKGIVLNAKNAEYDNKSQHLTLEFFEDAEDPWQSPFGNLDGGHTNRAILEVIDSGWEPSAEPENRQFVTVEILTGIDDERLSGLVGARNTNMPVKDLSLAVLGKELDWLLEIFENADVKDKIAWRQFEGGKEIAGEEVLAYLSLLNPELTEKIRCYTGAGRIVSDLKRRGQKENSLMEGLRTVAPVAVEYLKFVDYLHKSLEPWYEKSALREELKRSGFGGLKGITLKKEDDEPYKLVFLDEEIRYKPAKSWLMPLAHAFVEVVHDEKNSKIWYQIADEVGPKLLENIVNTTKEEKHNLNAVGKKKTFWSNLQSLVGQQYWRQKAMRKSA